MKRSARESEREAYVRALTRLRGVLPNLRLQDAASEAFLTIAATFVETAKSRQKIYPEAGTVPTSVPIKPRTSSVAIWNSIKSRTDKDTIAMLLRGKHPQTRDLFNSGKPQNDLMVYGPAEQVSLGSWFSSVRDGKDLLSRFRMAEIQKSRKGVLRKYGMKSPTDTGISGPGQIIELRALKRKIPYSEWASYMREITLLVPVYTEAPAYGNQQPAVPYNPALHRSFLVNPTYF